MKQYINFHNFSYLSHNVRFIFVCLPISPIQMLYFVLNIADRESEQKAPKKAHNDLEPDKATPNQVEGGNKQNQVDS